MTVHHLGHLDPDERLEFVDEEQGDELPPRPRLLPRSLLALAAVALFGGGLWVAYVLGTHHPAAPGDGVPLIRADPRPIKVKPDHPGGMEVPDRDNLIYGERPDGLATERLLPPAEGPLPRPAGPPGQVVPPDPSVPQATAGAPGAPAPQAAPGATSPAVLAKGVRVQLGAMRSEDLARQEWDRLRRRNADLLGTLPVTTVRADLGERGVFYRIQAGPLPDLKQAERICEEMRRRNFGCTIVR